jgi:hypothetical protein
MKLLKKYIPNKGAERICMTINPEKDDDIVQTSVYSMDYLYAALTKLKKDLPAESKIQIRFIHKAGIGIVMMFRVWNADKQKMRPEGEDAYVALAPVYLDNYRDDGDGDHFGTWSDYHKVVEIIEVDRQNCICPNHVVMSDEDMMEALEVQ